MQNNIPIGTILLVLTKGERREFICVDSRPYTRKRDGLKTTLYTWEGTCAVCGEAFQDHSGNDLRVSARCKTHRLKTANQRHSEAQAAL
jgi:hypothetical protein